MGENGYWVGSVAKGWAPGDPGEINGKKRELTGPKFDEYKTTPPTSGINKIDYARNFEAFPGRTTKRINLFVFGMAARNLTVLMNFNPG